MVFEPNKPTQYKPRLTILLPEGRGESLTDFLRVKVRNYGFTVARKCVATLWVRAWPPELGELKAPTDEPKAPIWTERGPWDTVDTHPRGGEVMLDLLLDPLKITEADRKRWSEKPPLVAWVGSPQFFRPWYPRIMQDGFFEDKYVIELTVFVENGRPCRKIFELVLTKNLPEAQLIPVRDP